MNTDISAQSLRKHSPGPWVVDDSSGEVIVYDAKGLPVAVVGTSADKGDETVHADAWVVVSAPRLLELLKIITDLAEDYGVGEHCDGNIIEAREVIALAEGKGVPNLDTQTQP